MVQSGEHAQPKGPINRFAGEARSVVRKAACVAATHEKRPVGPTSQKRPRVGPWWFRRLSRISGWTFRGGIRIGGPCQWEDDKKKVVRTSAHIAAAVVFEVPNIGPLFRVAEEKQNRVSLSGILDGPNIPGDRQHWPKGQPMGRDSLASRTTRRFGDCMARRRFSAATKGPRGRPCHDRSGEEAAGTRHVAV